MDQRPTNHVYCAIINPFFRWLRVVEGKSEGVLTHLFWPSFQQFPSSPVAMWVSSWLKFRFFHSLRHGLISQHFCFLFHPFSLRSCSCNHLQQFVYFHFPPLSTHHTGSFLVGLEELKKKRTCRISTNQLRYSIFLSVAKLLSFSLVSYFFCSLFFFRLELSVWTILFFP